MKIEKTEDTLRVSELPELSANNSQQFLERVRPLITADVRTIEVDFTGTAFLDSCGFGALIALHRALSGSVPDGMAKVRLLNPNPPITELCQLTQIQRLMEVASEPKKVAAA